MGFIASRKNKQEDEEMEKIIGANGHAWKIVGHHHAKNETTGKRDIIIFEVESPCCGCCFRDTEEYLMDLTYCPICGDGDEELSEKIHAEIQNWTKGL